jgi:hypothetical protein
MNEFDANRRTIALGLAAAGLATLAPSMAFAADGDYTQPEVIGAANRFFGDGAQGLSDVIQHVFAENGNPSGYIEGQEESAAIGVGVRYGEGRLHLRHRPESTRVFWQGPSVGFDAGGNASKSFTLVYGMTSPSQIFRRFPGAEGTAYFVGGVGVNYQRAEHITLAPMRVGVGFRAGVNIGYLGYSRHRRILPV